MLDAMFPAAKAAADAAAAGGSASSMLAAAAEVRKQVDWSLFGFGLFPEPGRFVYVPRAPGMFRFRRRQRTALPEAVATDA